ncbi:MAG: response regulator [Magnetococcus sp. DMHC-6]
MKLALRYSLIMLALIVLVTFSFILTLMPSLHLSMQQLTETSTNSASLLLEEHITAHSQFVSELLVTNLVTPLHQLDTEAIERFLNYTRQLPDISAVILFDAEGKVLHDGNKKIQRYGEQLVDVKFLKILQQQNKLLLKKENSMQIFMPIKLGGEMLGGVQVELSLDRLHQQIFNLRLQMEEIEVSRIKETLWIIFTVTLVLMMIGIPIALWIARGLSQSIAQLMHQMDALGRGNLEEPIILNRKDELGSLAQAMDHMRQNLREFYLEIKKQNQELKRLDQEKDNFLANITHEFKTPLNGLLGIGGAIQAGSYGPLPDSFHPPLNQMIHSASRLLRLTRQILSFAKEANTNTNAKPKTEAIQLSLYFDTLMDELMIQAQKKGIALRSQIDPHLTLQANKDTLDNIFINLIGNAIKFTQTGWVQLFARQVEQSFLAITVLDTGIGIAKVDQKKIFLRFQQGMISENSSYEGSGLGLSIATQSLEMMGGVFYLESHPGQGSAFTALFPLKPGVTTESMREHWQSLSSTIDLWATTPMASMPDICSVVPDSLPVANSSSLYSPEALPRILVVDDDQINREVVHANLNSQFYVIEAASGKECLEVIANNHVDLILLDLMMPGLSGFDVLAELSGQKTEISIPVIVLSAKDQMDDITRAFRMGSVDYITKPFHREELLARIQTHITLRHNANEILQRKLLEAELIYKKDLAESSTKAKSEFLANMSHEIRSPMNAVIGMTDLALASDLNAEQRQYLEIVQQSADNLLSLLNGILDFSKIEAGKLILEKSIFDFQTILEQASMTMAVKAHEKGLELLLDFDPVVPVYLEGDPVRLRQIIINLIGNAIKFTQYGEIIVRATLTDLSLDTSSTPQTWIHVLVSDSGIGIAEEKIDLIFQSFSQADASTTRKFGGTGLGLTISKQLVELMGGRMWVESVFGKGSHFNFSLPLVSMDAEINQTLFTSWADFSQLHFLVAEKHPTGQEIIRRTLSFCGATVYTVNEQSDLYAFLAQKDSSRPSIDLILADIRLLQPQMKGQLSYRLLLFQPRDLPQGAEKWTIDALNPQCVLLKPITCTALLSAVHTALGRSVSQPVMMPPSYFDATVPSLSIILAEDDPHHQQIATHILTKAGHRVMLIEKSETLFAHLAQEEYDLILMDIKMPQLDGLEATRMIRSGQKAGINQHIPIFAVTANATDQFRQLCLEAGMNEFFPKPYRTQKLLELVNTLANHKNVAAQQMANSIPKKVQILSPEQGDATLTHKRQLFLQEIPAQLELLDKGVREENYQDIEKIAALLKNAAQEIGADQFKNQSTRMVMASRKNQLETITSLYKNLVQRFDELAQTIKGDTSK